MIAGHHSNADRACRLLSGHGAELTGAHPDDRALLPARRPLIDVE